MPAVVTFTCVKGPLDGQEFSFNERATLLIGRAEDCRIRIPRTEETMEVSRHHCLVEVSPPLARIRDFGSLNGTFLNEERIGSRDPSQAPGQVTPRSPQRDLADGDAIRLAGVVLKVGIVAPVLCDDCRAEIPKPQVAAARKPGGGHRCPACRAKQAAELQREQERRRKQAQAKPAPKPAQPPKPDLKDPLALIRFLLEQAGQGAPEVQNIKGYEIVKTLGKGGMGAVYLARRQGTGQEVALKVMLPQVAANKDSVAKFQREMANATSLRHPNIVQSYESGYSDNTFYLTMEVCNGGSMDELLRAKGGKLDPGPALELIKQALDGLDYMHKAVIPNVKLANGKYGQGTGLVHRDLKPANLFLNKTGQGYTVKVADLGLAKAFDQAGLSGLTMTGQAAGSPPFMPRQQVIDFLNSKPEVDVWAIAATLYNMLTGAFPRDFQKGKDVWLTVLQTQAVPIRKRNPSIPGRIAEVIDAALVDKPVIGFASMREFRDELRRAM